MSISHHRSKQFFHRMKRVIFLLCFIVSSISVSPAQGTDTEELPSTLTHYPIVEGLRIPWGIVWGADNWLWITERFGRVSRINPETGEQKILLELKNVAYTLPKTPEFKKRIHNSGLLDIALDPKFLTNRFVYIFYAKHIKDSDYVMALSRFTYSPDTLTGEIVIYDKIPGFSEHDAGRMLFDPKGKLLLTTGDFYKFETPQDDKSPNGKILRINTDGSIPNDNPNPKSYVWAKGFRDPQGLAWGQNGKLYSSDHGPYIGDEINIIEKGGNYGWPDIYAKVDHKTEADFHTKHKTTEPIWYWTPTIAPGGIAYFNNPEYQSFHNSILVAFLKGARIIQLELDRTGTRVIQQSEHLKNEYGRLRSLCVAPDGRIFVTTSNADRKLDGVDVDDKIIVIIPPKD